MDEYSYNKIISCNRFGIVPTCVKRILSDDKIDVTVSNNLMICNAALFEQYDSMKLILEDGRCDPRASFSYPIRISTVKGNYDMVKLLIEDGRSDLTTYNGCLLRTSVSKNNSRIVELLLKNEEVVKQVFTLDSNDFSGTPGLIEEISKILGLSVEEVFEMYKVL